MFQPISKPKMNVGNSNRSNLFFKPLIQTKLSVNEPGDTHEQEADAMADKVMRISDINDKAFFSPPLVVQRKCAACEDEEKLQRKENADKTTVSEQTENYANNLSGGKSLENEEKHFFESKMGYDFSNVKIHTDSAANESAKNISALAYTHGNNIVFGSGTYQPNTDAGKKIMAHELTHVVQQGNGTVNSKVQRLSASRISFSQGTCGQRSVKFGFTLSNAASDDGYLVQQIDVHEIKSNSCPAISGPPAPIITFWEAFPVSKGATTHTLHSSIGYSDESGYPSNANSNGTSASYGEIKFFLKSTTGDLGGFSTAPATTGNGWGPGMVPRSGIVPSTASQPSWWTNSPAEGPVTRNAISQWDCCSTPNTSTVTANP